jgi:hypothetical protein
MIDVTEKVSDREVFDYLDDLRESGITNMFGAGAYIRNAFPSVTKAESYALLQKWMDTWDSHARKPRVSADIRNPQ